MFDRDNTPTIRETGPNESMHDSPEHILADTADVVALTQGLIRCPSVTPEEGGALQFLEGILANAGFTCDRVIFADENTPDIDNLFARLTNGEGPHLCFAGHTDVVPPGPETAWSEGPFAATITEDVLFGRGAVDMKGGIAAFLAATLAHIRTHGAPEGTISFLITGDEEGPAINGTKKLLQWADARGERFDACIVGEPTNPEQLGDMIKIGRRGSLSATLVVDGVQGHVAYPHLADNPIPRMVALLAALTETPLDDGSEHFQASNLEVTSVDVGNQATNVIPGTISARFNIRFNDLWTKESLVAELEKRLSTTGHTYRLDLKPDWSESFLTAPGPLVSILQDAVADVTGRVPVLSTSGGTSDARFIKNYCPVVEFGLVGQTMHKVDERVPVDDLANLTAIYRTFIERFFAKP